jgi:hypothetical protein
MKSGFAAIMRPLLDCDYFLMTTNAEERQAIQQQGDATMKHSRPTTTSTRKRRIVRTTVSAAALAFAVSPFGALAVASADYKESDFSACLERDMPTDYCCEHAGGVMRNGACIDPNDLLQPSGGVLQQVEGTPPPSKFPTGVRPGVLTNAPVLTLAP